MLSQLWSNQTGIKRTDAILTRLIRLTIETGSTAHISLLFSTRSLTIFQFPGTATGDSIHQ
jgi:hypothetical protein